MVDADRALRRWSLVLAWTWGLLVILALPILAIAALLLVADSSADQDDWDGFGTALGMAGIFVAGPVAVAGVVMVGVVNSGRRRLAARSADVTRLQSAGIVSLVLGAMAIAAVIGLSQSTGIVRGPVVLVLVCVVGPACGVVGAARRVTEAPRP